MKCPNCGAAVSGGRFCQYCGAMQAQPKSEAPAQPKVVVVQAPPQTVYVQAAPPPPVYVQVPQQPAQPGVPISGHSRWAAFILCLLLGFLGVHKFYVGKTGMGILYFITFGLFGVGWIVDLITIASGMSTDRWGRRLV